MAQSYIHYHREKNLQAIQSENISDKITFHLETAEATL